MVIIMTLVDILAIPVLAIVAIFIVLVIISSLAEDKFNESLERSQEECLREAMMDETLRKKMAKDAYRASQKSLKLDMMQAEALRQMRDVASKYDADFLKKSKKDVSS